MAFVKRKKQRPDTPRTLLFCNVSLCNEHRFSYSSHEVIAFIIYIVKHLQLTKPLTK